MPAFEIDHEQEGQMFLITGEYEKRWVDHTFSHEAGVEHVGCWEVDIYIQAVFQRDQDGGEEEIDKACLGRDIEDRLRKRFL